MEKNYLQWLADETPTSWWHDSADPAELKTAMDLAAVGVTTNPILAGKTLYSDPEKWCDGLPGGVMEQEKAEHILRTIVLNASAMYISIYEQSEGDMGYVCAQVNPKLASDRQAMLEMARRFSRWADNIAVKLPVTQAGLEALEDCIAEGITVTATVSYNVPQVVAVAEYYRKGKARAAKAGIRPGRCFAVIMIGRLDDYLRDIAQDRHLYIDEDDIRLAGLAVTKRAYQLYQQRHYEPTLIVAAMRGNYHIQELAGADVILSIHPVYQKKILAADVNPEIRIDIPVSPDVIERLKYIPDFVRSYEPDGMAVEDFFSFGLVQRTLTQFYEAGWSKLQSYDKSK